MHPWDEFDWHIKAEEQSAGLTVVQAFFATWGIAFFFLIAGAGTYLAMRWRSPTAFARERALRLLVPFTVVWATLAPVQSYLEDTFNDRFNGLSLSFLPSFFGDAWHEALELGSPVPVPIDKTYHLWFLIFLFPSSRCSRSPSLRGSAPNADADPSTRSAPTLTGEGGRSYSACRSR